MQCPLCASEIGSDAVACEKCGATRITQRSPLGVIVGWLGILAAICCAIVWLFMLALLIFGNSLNGFPWFVLFSGTLVAAALLFYSKSTIHAKWIRREG